VAQSNPFKIAARKKKRPRHAAAIHATLQKDMDAMATASGVAKNCTPASCRTTNNPSVGTVARAVQWKSNFRFLAAVTAVL
jgi:hypothetical protein